MARPPAVSKVLSVRCLWTDDAGTPHGIRQYFQYSGSAPSNTQLGTMADNIIATGWPYLAAQMSTEKTLTEVVIEDLSSDTAAVGLSTGTEPGELTGNYLPSSCVAICNFLIPRRYRGGHPRSAAPFGVQASLLNAQQWTTDSQGNFLTAITGYIGNVTEAGWEGVGALTHVNVSFYDLKVARTTPLVTAVEGYLVNQRVGAQRRRLGRSSG